MYPHAGARPAARNQNKKVRNLLVSYNLSGEVNLSLFCIASNWIGLPMYHPSLPSSHNHKPSIFGK